MIVKTLDTVPEALQPYWGFNNPKVNEYRDFGREGFNVAPFLETPYSERLPDNIVHEIGEIITQAVSGHPLFDIGSGPFVYPYTRQVARDCHASVYVGTDMCIDKFMYLPETEPPTFYVPSDMLLFLAKVHPNSGSFVFNGIDFIGGEYLEAILDELARATRPGGVVFGVGSEDIAWGLTKREQFEKIDHEDIRNQKLLAWKEEVEKNPNAPLPFCYNHDFFVYRRREGESK